MLPPRRLRPPPPAVNFPDPSRLWQVLRSVFHPLCRIERVAYFAAGGVYHEEGRVTRRGTKQRPAVVRVRTQDRADEILALCQEHAIQVIVGIEPDETEDISDVERILWPPVPAVAAAKVGRNDPCPCGSGKKYKKCCAGSASGA